MARLTLVIDDDLLQRARMRALAQGTTVHAVVREMLANYAADERVLDGRRGVAALARSSSAGREQRPQLDARGSPRGSRSVTRV